MVNARYVPRFVELGMVLHHLPGISRIAMLLMVWMKIKTATSVRRNYGTP